MSEAQFVQATWEVSRAGAVKDRGADSDMGREEHDALATELFREWDTEKKKCLSLLRLKQGLERLKQDQPSALDDDDDGELDLPRAMPARPTTSEAEERPTTSQTAKRTPATRKSAAKRSS